MQLDPEDIFAGTFGRIVVQVFLFVSAVWVGCSLGALALVVGACISTSYHALDGLASVLISPLLLCSAWLIPNIVVLGGGMGYFLISENAGFKAWGVVVAFESFFVMAGWSMDLQTAWPITMAWLAWLVLLGMVETGVWLIRQMLTNRWARELAVLNMENARRRAERDADENTRIKRDNDG